MASKKNNEPSLSASSPPAPILLTDPSLGTTLRASSVLQKNTKLYGPMNALDVNNGSSSWNSEGNRAGDTFLLVQFSRPVRRPTAVKFQFQAGFSARVCRVYAAKKGRADDQQQQQQLLQLVEELELEDVHELQECELEDKNNVLNNNGESVDSGESAVDGLKLVLGDFTDFYGRVILYRLEVWGYH